jgi:hypothetical protein
MPNAIGLLKAEIATLERDVASLAWLLKTKKDGLAILQRGTRGTRPRKAAKTPVKPSGTTVQLARAALKRRFVYLKPKTIQATIQELFGKKVSDGTLAAVLWTGADQKKVFCRGPTKGTYGLLEWMEPGAGPSMSE